MADDEDTRSSSKSSAYEVSNGEIDKKSKYCPKCGPGTFMASHEDRYTCGKCGYMEKK